MSNPVFLLDMDGVIAHFTCQLAKIAPKNQDQPYPDIWDIQQFYGFASAGEMWRVIDAQGEAFWSEMPETPWARELVDRLQDVGEVVICTSPAFNPVCASGKLKWIQRFFDDRGFREMVLTPRKHLLAGSGAILIDDTFEQVQKFWEAGGRAVQFPTPGNNLQRLASLDGQAQLGYLSLMLAQMLS